MSAPTKATLRALEKVFCAEIDDRLPFQSKAAIYKKLMDEGLLGWMAREFGSGWSAVTCEGYELTHAGRIMYCMSCDEVEP